MVYYLSDVLWHLFAIGQLVHEHPQEDTPFFLFLTIEYTTAATIKISTAHIIIVDKFSLNHNIFIFLNYNFLTKEGFLSFLMKSIYTIARNTSRANIKPTMLMLPDIAIPN